MQNAATRPVDNSSVPSVSAHQRWRLVALCVSVLVGGGLLAHQLSRPPGKAYAEMRSDKAPAAGQIADLKVSFAPDTSWESVTIALRAANATVVAGPSESGELWLAIAPEQAMSKAIATLKDRTRVDSLMRLQAAGK